MVDACSSFYEIYSDFFFHIKFCIHGKYLSNGITIQHDFEGVNGVLKIKRRIIQPFHR